jgi:hypothetical protein
MTAERPLTLSAAQVRALQSGPVEIRRKCRMYPPVYGNAMRTIPVVDLSKSPFGPIGARFWVREAWIGYYTPAGAKLLEYAIDKTVDGIVYHANSMPREYARLFPALTALRVEQINNTWYWIGTIEQVTK